MGRVQIRQAYHRAVFGKKRECRGCHHNSDLWFMEKMGQAILSTNTFQARKMKYEVKMETIWAVKT